MSTAFEWLDESGWCLVLPQSLSSQWRGISTDDYDRFCNAAVEQRWISQLPVGDGVAFVLGGDVGMALVHPMPDGVVKIIRWVFADDETDLVEFASGGTSVLRSEPDIVFENGERDWVLADATADLAVGDSRDVRPFALPFGAICVSTAYLEDGLNAAIVHTFARA